MSRTPYPAARDMAEHITDGNNAYSSEGLTLWGDANGGVFVNRANCSGFVNGVLARVYGLTPDITRQWMDSSHPSARRYYDAIQSGNGFTRIGSIDAVRVGDLLAIQYLPGSGNEAGDTGHVMIVAGVPRLHPASEPLVPDTRQWEIDVIDSATTGHGPSDTRRRADGHWQQGVGSGTLRLYTTAQGVPVGYSWSVWAASRFYGMQEQPIVIGRYAR